MSFEQLTAEAFEKVAQALELSLKTDIAQSTQITELANQLNTLEQAAEQASCVCPEGGMALMIATVALIMAIISILMLIAHKR